MTWQWVAVIFISWCFLSVLVAGAFGLMKSRVPRDEEMVYQEGDRPPLRNIKSVHDVNGPTLEERVAALERWRDDRDTGLDPRS